MQSFDIIRESKPSDSFRVASIRGTFDLQNEIIKEHFVGSFDMPEDWQIGLIVGNSGTGKTTIAKELFPDAYVLRKEFTKESVIDDLPEDASVKDITRTFNAVGFSSPPSWLKPYNVLSNGEKMRVDIANALLDNKDLIVYDEFTSVVDRQVAKITSFAVQKAIRQSKKKFIAVGCHFDVEEWLMPDWVFDTNEMKFRFCVKKKDQTSELNATKLQKKKRKFGNYLGNIII